MFELDDNEEEKVPRDDSSDAFNPPSPHFQQPLKTRNIPFAAKEALQAQKQYRRHVDSTSRNEPVFKTILPRNPYVDIYPALPPAHLRNDPYATAEFGELDESQRREIET